MEIGLKWVYVLSDKMKSLSTWKMWSCFYQPCLCHFQDISVDRNRSSVIQFNLIWVKKKNGRVNSMFPPGRVLLCRKMNTRCYLYESWKFLLICMYFIVQCDRRGDARIQECLVSLSTRALRRSKPQAAMDLLRLFPFMFFSTRFH